MERGFFLSSFQKPKNNYQTQKMFETFRKLPQLLVKSLKPTTFFCVIHLYLRVSEKKLTRTFSSNKCKGPKAPGPPAGPQNYFCLFNIIFLLYPSMQIKGLYWFWLYNRASGWKGFSNIKFFLSTFLHNIIQVIVTPMGSSKNEQVF